MKIRELALVDWRSYERVELSFGEGLTAIVGRNGEGKTNLVEAVAWLAGGGSFRGATDDADPSDVSRSSARMRRLLPSIALNGRPSPGMAKLQYSKGWGWVILF